MVKIPRGFNFTVDRIFIDFANSTRERKISKSFLVIRENIQLQLFVKINRFSDNKTKRKLVMIISTMKAKE